MTEKSQGTAEEQIEDRIIAWQAIAEEEDDEKLKTVMKIFPPTSVEIAHAQADTAILELQSVLAIIQKKNMERAKKLRAASDGQRLDDIEATRNLYRVVWELIAALEGESK